MDRDVLWSGVGLMMLLGVVVSGCQAAPARVWLDGGGEDRGLRSERVSLCGPALHPMPEPGLRGRCGADLGACLAAADDPGECFELEAGECFECVEQALFACATASAGCDEDYGAIACCREAECPDGDGACLQRVLLPGGACQPWVARFEACARDSAQPGEACAQHHEACGPLPDCFGRAHLEGRTGERWLEARWASAEHSSRGVLLRLSRSLPHEVREDERVLVLEVGTHVACAIDEAGALASVHCEVELRALERPSAAGVCDGWIAGSLRVATPEGTLEGYFSAPVS